MFRISCFALSVIAVFFGMFKYVYTGMVLWTLLTAVGLILFYSYQFNFGKIRLWGVE